MDAGEHETFIVFGGPAVTVTWMVDVAPDQLAVIVAVPVTLLEKVDVAIPLLFIVAVPITLPREDEKVTVPLVARFPLASVQVAWTEVCVCEPPLPTTCIEFKVVERRMDPFVPPLLVMNETVVVDVFSPAVAVTVHDPAVDAAVRVAVAFPPVVVVCAGLMEPELHENVTAVPSGTAALFASEIIAVITVELAPSAGRLVSLGESETVDTPVELLVLLLPPWWLRATAAPTTSSARRIFAAPSLFLTFFPVDLPEFSAMVTASPTRISSPEARSDILTFEYPHSMEVTSSLAISLPSREIVPLSPTSTPSPLPILIF
jgi:hypothetical protein